MNYIYHRLRREIQSGSRLVLATVVRTAGSTPQKPGSSALFGEAGLIDGTVGGGIIEGEVEQIAKNVLISGVSNHYYFNLNTNEGEEGSICGGESVVLVDANPGTHLKSLEAMEQSLNHRQGGHLITAVGRENEVGRSIERHWVSSGRNEPLPLSMGTIVRDAIAIHMDESVRGGFSELDLQQSAEVPYEMVILESIKPLPHLVIVGGGHIGKALAHLGRLLEFEIIVIDDRPEFANEENIPDADHHLVQDIAMAVGEINTGPETYIVMVTRGHNHDAEALKQCIGSNAAYIGMIGSSNKVRIMKKQFISEGLATVEEWSKVHTPIGLPIGSTSVQEIAVSIAAELVKVRSQLKKKDER